MATFISGSRYSAGFLCVILAACGGGGGDNGSVATQAGISTVPTGSTTVAPSRSTAASPSAGQTSPAGNTSSGSSGATAGDSASGGTVAAASATDARFNRPLGLARDAAGNMYVADSGNNTIRKISASGNVVTLAGTAGTSGTNDGIGAAARFSFLKGLTVDGAGNVYAVDGNAVRKVTPTGAVRTLAGVPGIAGDTDGPGATARFSQPWGIVADSAGNVYVADTDNFLIRRIAPDGMVTTYAGSRGNRGTGNGSIGSVSFLGPKGIARDAGGNLYVTDWYGPPAPMLRESSTFIRKIATDGTVSTLAGTYGGESGPAQFHDTFAITVDGGGNVFVAAFNSVQRISAAGAVTNVAGPVASMQSLEGITIDASANLFVADTSSHAISRVTTAGEVTVVAGNVGEAGAVDVP